MNNDILLASDAHNIAMTAISRGKPKTEHDIAVAICDAIRKDAGNGNLSAVYSEDWLRMNTSYGQSHTLESVAEYLRSSCGYDVKFTAVGLAISWAK